MLDPGIYFVSLGSVKSKTVTTMLLVTVIICSPFNPLGFSSCDLVIARHTVMCIKAGVGLLTPYHLGNKRLSVCVVPCDLFP